VFGATTQTVPPDIHIALPPPKEEPTVVGGGDCKNFLQVPESLIQPPTFLQVPESLTHKVLAFLQVPD
jgi:hypothetical protein